MNLTFPLPSGYAASSFSLRHKIAYLCELRGIDLGDLIKQLEVCNKSFLKIGQEDFALSDLDKIADFFELTIDELVFQEIDEEWIKNPQIQPKYFKSRGSKFRTSLPAFKYVREVYGEKFFQFVRKKLQIPSSQMKNYEQEVSLELLNDLLSILSQTGVRQNEFWNMGQMITKISENSEIKSGFENCANPFKVFELLFDEVILRYEKNFNYKIRRKFKDGIEVEVNAKDERKEEFHSHVIDNHYVSQFRHSACAAHLNYINVNDFKTWFKNSVHQGDQKEVFEIRWN